MNREAQSVVLFLLGGAILRISVTDVYLRYVKTGLRPFLVAAGVLLIVIAVTTLARELYSRRGGATSAGTAPAGADDGHDHGSGGPRVGWLLMLPVLAVFLVAPPALGSYAASRGGTAIAERSDFPPLPKADPAKITMLDYASRAVWEKGVSLTDRRVRLTGFVSPRPGGGVYLVRMILTCCAADARPIKVTLSGEVPDRLAADTWVEVVGRYDPKTDKDKANDETIPYLEVESLQVVPQPTDTYEQ